MKQTTFEMFLDRLDPAWRGDQLAFFRTVAAVGTDAVEELGARTQRIACPPALKCLTLEFSFYFPWPEWVPVLERILRHEKDLDLFETGARALGRIRSPEALETLRTLSQSRATPQFRAILDRVLQESDPDQAFQHHFARLMQGSAQPSEANEGAHQMEKLLRPDSLGTLSAVVGHPDPLVYRHVLRLLGRIPSQEAATFLLDYLRETHREALEDREVRTLLNAFRSLPRPEVQEKTAQALQERLRDRQPGAAEELGSGDPERIKAAAPALQGAVIGILEAFLLDALLASLEEKPAHLAKHLGGAGEAAQQRTRRLDFALDVVPQDLAHMAEQGFLDAELLLPVLAESLRHGTARVGVASAMARLVPTQAQALLELLLTQADGALRGAAVEILGGRKDPALRPALMTCRRDAIAEIADRSLFHLGQLPDPTGGARAFLADPDPEEIKVGLRFIAMHHLEDLVPDLLARASGEGPEGLLLATLNTLGSLGSPRSVEPLLALLHSGQGPRIQTALAEAIRDLGLAEGALGLCDKAAELNNPSLHALAVEAFARAHGSPERPLLSPWTQALTHAVSVAWGSRNPWPLRRRVAEALPGIHMEQPSQWREIAALVQDTANEKRSPGEVSAEDFAKLQSCARALAQLAGG